MSNNFRDSFKINSNYLSQISPYWQAYNELEQTKQNKIKEYALKQDKIMKVISDIENNKPECNHEICLGVLLKGEEIQERYICLSCGYISPYRDSQYAVMIDKEITEKELKVILESLRDQISLVLNDNPDVSMEDLTDFLADYINLFIKGR